ncbi:protein S100-G-like [Bombina bombina]|uniref:protein S100-G-like n=1 Tax=Bombina bombina TaxID=8345 RepID=UPI00235AE05A|nr:protein S100-G-like [Bombina bombina]XP_053551504.1 protein S100-G-like [Bombina bombina]
MGEKLEDLMIKLIGTFKTYAGKDGDGNFLNQDELCELATKEFPTLCTSGKKDEILKGIIGEMDMDGDKKVSFKEFIIFFGFLSLALEDYMGKK